MPSPPSANGQHTKLHATRAPPLAGFVLHQKKLCMTPLRRRRTPAGIQKADIKYVEMAEKTAFTKTRRPPRDSNLPCHPPRRVSTFSTAGCQFWILRWRLVNGRPRYQIRSVHRYFGQWSTVDPGSPQVFCRVVFELYPNCDFELEHPSLHSLSPANKYT